MVRKHIHIIENPYSKQIFLLLQHLQAIGKEIIAYYFFSLFSRAPG